MKRGTGSGGDGEGTNWGSWAGACILLGSAVLIGGLIVETLVAHPVQSVAVAGSFYLAAAAYMLYFLWGPSTWSFEFGSDDSSDVRCVRVYERGYTEDQAIDYALRKGNLQGRYQRVTVHAPREKSRPFGNGRPLDIEAVAGVHLRSRDEIPRPVRLLPPSA